MLFTCYNDNFVQCYNDNMLRWVLYRLDSIKSIIEINLFNMAPLNFKLHVWLTLQHNTIFTIWFIVYNVWLRKWWYYYEQINNKQLYPIPPLNCYKILMNKIKISDICSNTIVTAKSWTNSVLRLWCSFKYMYLNWNFFTCLLENWKNAPHLQ